MTTLKEPVVSFARALDDENVSNYLFRLPGHLLEKPGLVAARWNSKGELRKEVVWSFEMLQTRVRQCIGLLVEQGLKPGDRVLLMVRPGLELITLCFALFRLGVVPIVIDPGMGLRKFQRAVAHSQPRALVGIPLAHVISRLFPQSFRSVQKRVVVHPWRFLQQLERVEVSDAIEVGVTGADDLAAVLFTSGSTGAPKGVCYEHGMFRAQIRLLQRELRIESGESDLPMLPIFALFNPALGMTTIIPEINPSKPATVNPVKVVAAIKRYGVTNSFGSPVLWRKIGDYCDKQGVELPTMRRILVAGAAAPTQLYRQFERILPNGEMYSPYGATECLPVSLINGKEVLHRTAAETDKGAGICVGKPLEEVQIKIISADCAGGAIEELPEGEIGEIMVHGPSVTKAYDQLPEATRRAKHMIGEQVWHRMGDMGYRDLSGLLWFCGRKVEAIDGRDGTRYYTEKIEGPFLTHPDVKRCALTKWTAPGETEATMVLVVQPVDDRWPKSFTEKQVFAKSLLDHINSRGVTTPIRTFFFMRSLPVDVRHNAKIHRLTLQRLIEKKEPVRVEPTQLS